MKKLIMSTVSFHNWENDLNKRIEIIRNFDIDGVEVAFRTVKDLLDFELSEENKEFLNSFEFNTIHAPYRECYNPNEILEKIIDLSREINAKNIIFHPQESLKNKDLDFEVSIENMKIKEPLAEELLDTNKKFKLCFDVAHAGLFKGETERLFKKYSDRISEVHFSADSEEKRHVPLINARGGFFNDLNDIKRLDVPFVLEAVYPPNGIELIKKDIEFARKWLK